MKCHFLKKDMKIARIRRITMIWKTPVKEGSQGKQDLN